MSALSASTIGIFLFYKPNSKAGNGFRWAIAPMGTVVARQLSQNGFTEATLVTSLLVFVVLMLMLWPFGYIIYKKKADTNDQQKIIAKKDIDMGLRGGDTMKSSDDDIANEISSSEMSDYEKAGNELETGNHVKGLWIKADVDADGDAGKRKRLYIKMRVSQLAEEREAKKKLRRREEKRREEKRN